MFAGRDVCLFPDMFDNINLLQKGLDAAQLRQNTIANNIANIDTPGFKTSHVEFESYMQEALGQGEDTFVGKRTNSRHIAIGAGGTDPEDVEPTVVQDGDTTMRMDGNNNDIDAQMVDMVKNTVYYNTLGQKLSKEVDRLRLAIDGK